MQPYAKRAAFLCVWCYSPSRNKTVSFTFLHYTQLDVYNLHDFSEGVINTVAKAATYTTHVTQEINMQALSGIRTRDPSSQSAAELRLAPHSHQNGHGPYLTTLHCADFKFYYTYTIFTCNAHTRRQANLRRFRMC